MKEGLQLAVTKSSSWGRRLTPSTTPRAPLWLQSPSPGIQELTSFSTSANPTFGNPVLGGFENPSVPQWQSPFSIVGGQRWNPPRMDGEFLDALRYPFFQAPSVPNNRAVLGMGYHHRHQSLFQRSGGRSGGAPLVSSFGGKIRSSGGQSPFGAYGGGRGGVSLSSSEVYWHYNPGPDVYSRKVFVGGLPIDIDEDEIQATFSRFGPLVVDWPHKSQSRAYFPPIPKGSFGYVFLIFEHEKSVQAVVENCHEEGEKYYICVSSPTMRDKPVQVRPWRLADADFVVDASLPLDPRRSVFIGGVPRPLKAVELATIIDKLFGGVCYAGIDTDPELKYPKGAGRVAFSNQQSYTAAITARFVQLQQGDVDKRVEVKPYVLDDQMCDECHGQRCGGKYAPLFCANVSCLQYFCESCWASIHSRQGREYRPSSRRPPTDPPGPPPLPPSGTEVSSELKTPTLLTIISIACAFGSQVMIRTIGDALFIAHVFTRPKVVIFEVIWDEYFSSGIAPSLTFLLCQ